MGVRIGPGRVPVAGGEPADRPGKSDEAADRPRHPNNPARRDKEMRFRLFPSNPAKAATPPAGGLGGVGPE